MLKLLAEAFENLTKVFRKTNNPAVKDELIKIGDELEALSEQVQKGSGKIEEQTTQLKTILTNLDGQAKQIDEGLDDIISTIDEYDPPSVTNRPQGKSANMADSAERSIQFVAEKTGLSFEEARLAVMEKINQGYPIGDLKRTAPNDMAQIKAYLDNNLNYGADDVIEFLEDIEEIAFSGAIDLSSDTAKNVSKQTAKDLIASGDDPAAKGFAKSVDVGSSDDLQKSLDLTDSYGFQVTKDLDDVVPFNELSPQDIEKVKLGVPMNSKTYRREMEAINKGEMAPSQMSGIPESQAKSLKILEDELLGGMDMKTYTKVNNANVAEKERIIAVANDLIEEGRMTEARELLESIGEDLSADRVLNANGGYMSRPKAFLGGLFGDDEEIEEDPEYRSWKKIYRQNPDVADMHEKANIFKAKMKEEMELPAFAEGGGVEDGGESNFYIMGQPATEEEYNTQGGYMDLTPEGMDLFKAYILENPNVDQNIILDALKKQGYSGDMQGFASGGGVGSLFRMR